MINFPFTLSHLFRGTVRAPNDHWLRLALLAITASILAVILSGCGQPTAAAGLTFQPSSTVDDQPINAQEFAAWLIGMNADLEADMAVEYPNVRIERPVRRERLTRGPNLTGPNGIQVLQFDACVGMDRFQNVDIPIYAKLFQTRQGRGHVILNTDRVPQIEVLSTPRAGTLMVLAMATPFRGAPYLNIYRWDLDMDTTRLVAQLESETTSGPQYSVSAADRLTIRIRLDAPIKPGQRAEVHRAACEFDCRFQLIPRLAQ